MGDRYVPDDEGSTLKEHTADVWLISEGGTMESMFRSAVSGLYRVMAEEFILEEGEKREESFSGNQIEEVMIDILSEALYLFDAESCLMIQPVFDIQREEDGLKVRMEYLLCEAVIPEGAQGMEVKAATYHGAEVEEEEGLYRCKILLDV